MRRYVVRFCASFVEGLAVGCAWLLVLLMGAYFLPDMFLVLTKFLVALSAALTHYAQS